MQRRSCHERLSVQPRNRETGAAVSRPRRATPARPLSAPSARRLPRPRHALLRPEEGHEHAQVAHRRHEGDGREHRRGSAAGGHLCRARRRAAESGRQRRREQRGGPVRCGEEGSRTRLEERSPVEGGVDDVRLEDGGHRCGRTRGHGRARLGTLPGHHQAAWCAAGKTCSCSLSQLTPDSGDCCELEHGKINEVGDQADLRTASRADTGAGGTVRDCRLLVTARRNGAAGWLRRRQAGAQHNTTHAPRRGCCACSPGPCARTALSRTGGPRPPAARTGGTVTHRAGRERGGISRCMRVTAPTMPRAGWQRERWRASRSERVCWRRA